MTDGSETARAAAAVDPEAGLEDFLLNAHRLASLLGDASAFASNNVSLSEWAVLKALGNEKKTPFATLVKNSGVSRQRLRTLLVELEGKKLVEVEQAAEGDQRQRTVSATAAAADVSNAVSRELRALGAKLISKSEKAGKRFVAASRLSGKLAKALRRQKGEEKRDPNAPERPARKRRAS